MKFSILIANYNNGKFFKTCFESLLAQDHLHWEAIILDDASTDDSVAVISELIKNDARFFLYSNEKNLGVGGTKKKLIALAQNEICGFVDPDDALLPDAISSCLRVFRNEKNTVLTYSKFAKCDADLQPVSVPKSSSQVPCGDIYFFNCPVQIVHFVAFRKAVYLQTSGINSSLKIAEDQDLYLKMYEKGDVRFIDKVLYWYRIHSGSISQNENLPKSRAYFAKVIFDAMQRRRISSIRGKKIRAEWSDPQEIFDLLQYQAKMPFRIRKKIKVLSQKMLKK